VRSLNSCALNFLQSTIVVFLEHLATYAPLPTKHIGHLGALYEVANSANAEIRLRFYNVALKDPTSLAALEFTDQALKWVTGRDGTGVIKGRMKFCRPTFRAASRVNASLAKEYFARSKEEFHPIARKLIEKVRVGDSLAKHRLLTAWKGSCIYCT
jgi:leukotriene-A4 hydrolase